MSPFAVSAIVIAAMVFVLWIISVPLKDASIVDLFWAAGFALVAGVLWSRLPPSKGGGLARPSEFLLPLLTALWALRYSWHLWTRNIGRGEDKRYVAMRERRSESFWWKSLFIVFLLQGTVMWVVSLPLQMGITAARPGWTIAHVIGILLWSIGLFFEAVGDWQLSRFRANPANKGRVLDTGLWSWTRHPNYFGDSCLWWGLFLIAAAHGDHLWTAIGPLTMTYFLMRISGVTLLEQTLIQERPGYAEYVQRTSSFLPWPPKNR